MVIISGTMKIDSGRISDFRAFVKRLISETVKEAGCVNYRMSADLEDEALIHVFEEWASQDALNAHLKAPHMKEFQQKIGTAIGERNFRFYKAESVQPMAR